MAFAGPYGEHISTCIIIFVALAETAYSWNTHELAPTGDSCYTTSVSKSLVVTRPGLHSPTKGCVHWALYSRLYGNNMEALL
ncbi:uncharacterized protein EI90DRAFT_3090410 [Cantharellus anzutake]|uniref:uncharacterized protein n=1 Tax=Cantharellus anzutake TaxID=1750568 RepID=UPI0019087380|nr:uncharacterized protein EI90DRAFT_3102837 [Cantharellus anzutake]XP_038908592.1 uncharacterized protein EI90DRAFT_3090410 [Cantharellus anzutake]KAF8309955.1 hypothetical protein EI90DRAFT_3102837 [Cantharellus anzutake]KAF8314390.1 hypothetical protein EI90DRAFT_3090410 [Cantharellus anzutake]